MIKEYKNYRGEDINLSSLEDKKLVLLYKFFQRFCKIATRVKSSGNIQNKDQLSKLVDIRDSLKDEVQGRHLKISSFVK
jgi:flagellin-specific chaperone FliS